MPNARRSRKAILPRTAEQFFAKPERVQATLKRVTDAIYKMRTAGLSLRNAAREAGTTPRTVTRWAGSAIRKGTDGHYSAKRGDQLLRVLLIPTPEGLLEIGVRGFRQASTIGEYWAAVDKYTDTGDFTALAKFSGKTVRDATGKVYPLLTDRAELKRLGNAGVLGGFESIYARSV